MTLNEAVKELEVLRKVEHAVAETKDAKSKAQWVHQRRASAIHRVLKELRKLKRKKDGAA